MIKHLLLLSLVIVAGCTNGKATAQNKDCRVIAILDGDTLECVSERLAHPRRIEKITVRLSYIDAPEKGQAFGQVSKRSLSDMVYQKQVTLKIHGQDKYNRTLAEVFYQDTNINQQMIRLGMAWAYRDFKPSQAYIELENQAKNSRLGLWSEPSSVSPSEWRKINRQLTSKQGINNNGNQQ